MGERRCDQVRVVNFFSVKLTSAISFCNRVNTPCVSSKKSIRLLSLATFSDAPAADRDSPLRSRGRVATTKMSMSELPQKA